MIRNGNAYSSMDQRIDSIRVSESDRQIAKEHMRDADFVADLVCRATENSVPPRSCWAGCSCTAPSRDGRASRGTRGTARLRSQSESRTPPLPSDQRCRDARS
jgi:hypothetical protein